MSEILSLANSLALRGPARRIRVRPLIIHAAVATLVIFSVFHAVATYSAAVQQRTSLHNPLTTTSHQASAQVTISTAPNQPASGASAVGGAPAAKAAPAVPSLPNCTPDSYGGVTALDLSSSQTGLAQLVDAPHYYQIYGYNAAQARQQINQCAPRLSNSGDDFTGYTSYRLSWLYNYGDNGSGQCSLSNVRVGMHIGEVLPSLPLSQYADSGFAAKWQAFAPSLDTHERGHIALDEQYASKILNDLQAMPATDCGTISQAASNLINSDVAALNQANSTYDAQTNHGATQGAVLP